MSVIIDEIFCQHIAKLFYAIACADKSITKVEYDTFKSQAKSIEDQFSAFDLTIKADMYNHITSTFNALYLNNEESKVCFESFRSYLKSNTHVFSKPVRKLLLIICNDIATSFSGRNKSELVLLAKLSLEFDKI